MSETKSIQSGPVTRGQIEAMNTIPVGKSIVDKEGLKRTVIERTSKFFKIQRGTNAGAANFQNLNEKEKGEKVYGSSTSYEESEPSDELLKLSSSGQGSRDGIDESEKTEESGEKSKQSSFIQRTSNEESERTEPSEELPKQSSSGQRTSNEESKETPNGNEESEKTEQSEEDLNQSGSVQRTSIEESVETEPSEELLIQSSSGQKTSNGNEESEKTEPSEEDLNQSSSGPRTSNEKSNVKEKDEDGSRSSISNEESEETEPSVNAFYQFKDNLVRWFQSLGGGDQENSSDKEKDEDASGTTTANEVTEAEKEPLSQSSSGPEKRLKERLQETTNVVKTTSIYEVDENKTPEESTFSWKLMILIAIMLVLFFGMLAMFSSVESISTFFSI